VRSDYPWQVVAVEDLRAVERHRDVLRWATELSDTLSQADSHRLDAQRPGGHRA
jgi:hypothetical protein